MMEKMLEKLWDDYWFEACAAIESEEERILVKRAAEAHKNTSGLLTKEQNDMMEKYIDILNEIQSAFGKKAFLKGCEVAAAFFFEAGLCRKP
ncbi:MAG: hypothetical protein IKM00_08770 [Clostridia bacterium]|nr:hypothetical protein [Clostridia bacterium]